MSSKLTGAVRWVAVAVLAAVAVVLPAGTANADDGDGKANCNSGEICFWYNHQTYYQKQFWYTNNHGGNNFWYFDNAEGEYYVSDEPVQDNALYSTNKDTQCAVRVGDYSNGLWVWKHVQNDWSHTHLGAVNNRNDRHERLC
jgi:hypothetical protein